MTTLTGSPGDSDALPLEGVGDLLRGGQSEAELLEQDILHKAQLVERHAVEHRPDARIGR
jgi:hypothetical protein